MKNTKKGAFICGIIGYTLLLDETVHLEVSVEMQIEGSQLIYIKIFERKIMDISGNNHSLVIAAGKNEHASQQ